MRLYVLAVVAVASVVAYGKLGSPGKPLAVPPAEAGKAQGAPRPAGDNLVFYTTRDERMNAAKAQARTTLPRFLDLVAAKAPGRHTVKFPLTQNGATEHIWLQVDAYRNGAFDGRLANTPVNGARYRMGDRMRVPIADVEDWSVIDGEAIYGGYTSRVALADVPSQQAKARSGRFRD